MTTRKKIQHPWIEDRKMVVPCLVLRIDDYSKIPMTRGQFYPEGSRYDDDQKAIWPNMELATRAAEWATKKFGHQYGVFAMFQIVEPAEAPIKHTKVAP